MPDVHYTHPRLAEIYDLDSPWAADKDFYLSLAGSLCSKVLDLGRGSGILCDGLARIGHEVTGVDPAAAMLEVARRKPQADKIEWVLSSAQDYRSSIDKRVSEFIPIAEAFLQRFSDEISEPRRAIVEKYIERYPDALKRRVNETNTQTLIHGDAHFWNFLFPKDKSKPPVLIDWQGWQINFGTADLAYMIGLHWFPERRKRFEIELLKVYLEELHRHGIEYSYDDMWYDYRLQIAFQLATPMVQAHLGIPASIWWPHLDRAFSAFDDLECTEFLE